LIWVWTEIQWTSSRFFIKDKRDVVDRRRGVEAMTEWLGIAIALIALFCLLWWLDNREPLSGWFGG
jgi:hypothetical protein